MPSARPARPSSGASSAKAGGWCETAYDDGGFSGGSMERPPCNGCSPTSRQGRVDIVVVYKVDRLTRSLTDFAKIVELFDRSGVSFVAVTQQFNTTTSMGRLTLNILLSFAQFEREVTGERIRDKIAASKRKGMWMGGVVPLGYDVLDRKLVVNPAEAETVRLIYRRYLELGCVRLLQEDLARQGIRSKARISSKGVRSGDAPIARGALYALLGNPLYIGETRHKGACYPGQHESIVDRELWEAVQRQLRDQSARPRGKAHNSASAPLTGKIFDESGARLKPTYAMKKGRRYSYYVSPSLMAGSAKDTSRCWRLPAVQIEAIVASAAAQALEDRAEIARLIDEAGIDATNLPRLLHAAGDLRRRLLSETERAGTIALLVDRVELRQDELRLTISLASLCDGDGGTANDPPLTLEREVPLKIKRRGVEMRLVIESRGARAASVDPILLKEVARAHRCVRALLTGDVHNLASLAEREGVSDRYVSLILPLAFLAPEIVAAITLGRQPADLTAHKLIRHTDLPIDWHSQKRVLGIR